MKRPNILFLMSDEHRFDFAGFAGHPVVRTPNLDRLAEKAVVFDNAYTPSPICIPGRQCLASGQLPKTNHCEGWVDLAPHYPTFPRHFARHAYHTVCAGKLHHLGVDQMQGWTKRIAPDAEVAADQVPDRIPGEFQKYVSPDGLGKWGNQKEIERAGPGRGPYQDFDDEVVASSKSFIRKFFLDPAYDRPGNHRPLLFKVSLLEPHYPFFAEPELFEYYLNRVKPFDEKPCDHPVLSLSQNEKPVQVSPRDLRRVTAAYHAMCESMDRRLGEVVSALGCAGENLDEWLIVYTSDHGEMLGQHGIWEKTRFYEASVRVPLFIRWPKAWAPRRVSQNVNLCDLFATLCDAADLAIPPGLDSRSLVPLCEGKGASWRDESISQMQRRHLMIKQGSLKYQYYGENVPEVLFDLEADPGEMVNALAAPRHRQAVEAFRRRRDQLGHGPNGDPRYVNAGYGGS